MAVERLVFLEKVESKSYRIFTERIEDEAARPQIKNAKWIFRGACYASKLLETGVAPTIEFKKQQFDFISIHQMKKITLFD
ncbi:MAG TPA: hypothetical protein DDZ51_11515 [Planctomycetaceae bacterium]|nr:hypothetical protein [Planctomycetaceae bacterium]